MQPYLQRLTVVFLLTLVIFTTVPSIDLWVAGLFYNSETGVFPAAQSPFALGVRSVMMNAMLLFPVVALIFLLLNLWKRNLLGVTPLMWGKILALFLLGPGLLVNGILKSYWGRARPAYITEFGGDAAFTPPFQITDQCARNCSFVSGEASGAVAVAIGIFVLTSASSNPVTARNLRRFAIFFAIVGSGMRVAMGRHFLSDTIFAVLFVLLISYGLDVLIARKKLLTLAK
ncbi:MULTISPECIES: phosphatase PAP2 family protein [Falsihalocynthiibacter]|uniref:phosphatase PAP2 family protein n=1 Tax=Falsihalocynthiibacter TaxID=2854182 RepID=UPI003002260D